MALVKLFPVEDSHLQLLDNWLRKDHVIKWYNDADEWLNEIRARNAEFSFLHHLNHCILHHKNKSPLLE